MEALTDYERERLERIRQNKERMKALNLDTMAAQLIPDRPKAAPKTSRGLAAKRRAATDTGPPRRSSRIKGEASDGAQVEHEGARGALIVSGIDLGKPSEPAGPKERHPQGDLPFKSINDSAGPAADAAFLALLAFTSGSGAGEGTRTPKAKAKATPPTGVQLAGLALKDRDVAKVCSNSIVHLAFAPRQDALVLAAADKKGGLGLWCVDVDKLPSPGGSSSISSAAGAAAAASGSPGPSKEEETNGRRSSSSRALRRSIAVGKGPSPPARPAATEGVVALENGEEEDGEEEAGFDGVLSFAPHHQYISGMRWTPDLRLYTASYDGSLRVLDATRGIFTLAWADEEAEYSCMDVTADGRTAFLGDNEGSMDCVDLRSGRKAFTSPNLHARKINTVHVEPGAEGLLATSSTDATVAIWDLRAMGAKAKPAASESHRQSCHAAFFCPDGSKRVLSTSFDDTIRVWRYDGGGGVLGAAASPGGKKKGGGGAAALHQELSLRHNNQTGRWVVPFRAVWTPAGDAFAVGSMQRPVELYDAESGEEVGRLHGLGMTAIAARNCCHPGVPVLAAGTASGRLHVFR